MLLHTLSKKVYAQRMSFWLPFRHAGLSDSRSIENSPSATPKHKRNVLGSIDFSEQVFDKSELQDILLQRLEKIRDEGSGFEAQELQRKIVRLEQLDRSRRRNDSAISLGDEEGEDYLQSHYLELLDAEAELNPDASQEYIAHTEELMFYTSNEAREAF